MDKFAEYTSEELENRYNELSETIYLMNWDMRQQADGFDYAVKSSIQAEMDEIEKELIQRGVFVE